MPASNSASPCCRSPSSPWPRRRGLLGILTIPSGVDRVLLPGLCQGDLAPLRRVDGGGRARSRRPARPARILLPPPATRHGYGTYDIAILAEINHAPRLRTRRAVAPGAGVARRRCRRDRRGLRSRLDVERGRRCGASVAREPGCASRSTVSTRARWRRQSAPGRSWC